MTNDLLYRHASRVTAFHATDLSVAISFAYDDVASAATRSSTRKEA